MGAGARTGDVVNVVGTSTCIIAMSDDAQLIPGVCGVVPGSVHPKKTGVEAGLSATGDIFSAIAQRANSAVAALSVGLESYVAGQTGLLRLTWDNGDRTVLVNPELGGITLAWNLEHSGGARRIASVSIEGTAFHTRIILKRMEEHGVPIHCVINAGGIPQKNDVLNHVYANVLNKPILDSAVRRDQPGFGDICGRWQRRLSTAWRKRVQQALCPEASCVIEPDPKGGPRVRGAVRAVPRAEFWIWQAGCRGYFGGPRPACAAEDCGERATGHACILKSLREEVLEANLELVRRGLVLCTFGNASGISRSDGLVAIKPSGVSYERHEAGRPGRGRSRGKSRGAKWRPSSDLPTHLLLYKAFAGIGGRGAYALAVCDRVGAGGTRDSVLRHDTRGLFPRAGAGHQTADSKADSFRLRDGTPGNAIVRRFTKLDLLLHMPGVLVAGHAPFSWGASPSRSCARRRGDGGDCGDWRRTR